MPIERVREVTDELVEAFARLMPQLSPGSPALTVDELNEIVANPSNVVLVARDVDRIVGTATVVLVHIPSGRRARIESVVVDAAARGRGHGETLCRAAVDVGLHSGAAAIDLTSAPARVAANRLYERLGFTRGTTNVYRLEAPRNSLPR